MPILNYTPPPGASRMLWGSLGSRDESSSPLGSLLEVLASLLEVLGYLLEVLGYLLEASGSLLKAPSVAFGGLGVHL